MVSGPIARMDRAARRRAISLAILFGSLPIAVPASAASLTLEEAWRRAEAANPSLQAAQTNLPGLEGLVTDTRAPLWYNPLLTADGVRRRVPQTGLGDQTHREGGMGIAQTFEIAGQQGYRREAAQQELIAFRAALQDTRRQLRAQVEQRFVRVLALQARITTEQDAVRLVENAAAAVRKRVQAGEDNRLDGNLATVEAERSRNQLALLGEQLTDARADLAAALQLPPEQLPEANGEIAPMPAGYSFDQLLASAEARPQLRALELRERAARSRLSLERAAVYPDITLGLSAAREGPAEARQQLVGLTVSVPLPVFRRNAAGIGRASGELTLAQLDRFTVGRDVRAQVFALWQKVESLRERVRRLTETVQPALDDNQRLSAIAYREGEIGLLQLIVVNRQVLDGRRDLLEARAELRATTVALEAAAGWPNEGSN